ncbi:transposase family protein [Bradyrhizobium sp. 8-10B]|uniref:transposase family protein n=1 Tax=Bradyrhizobium sp. 8-10B TaxID=3344579 RepID=UPI0035C1824F
MNPAVDHFCLSGLTLCPRLKNGRLIEIRASGSVGLCPLCGTVSRRVHSRYRRRVTDLPLSGRIVQLLVIARRFRCDAVLCARFAGS